MRAWSSNVALAVLAVACASPDGGPPRQPAAPKQAEPEPEGETPPAPRDLRDAIDGRGFPDGVIALTWDDGPDRGTLELAEYLRRERISATFFVVGAWADGVSADPGVGRNVFTTGADSLPLLGDLVALGHRVGNHTKNHVLLARASGAVVREQLDDDQRRINPFVEDELPLFRVPGGAWSNAAADAAAADPTLADLVGPVRWDIDRKDWQASLDCYSRRPALECEPAGPGGALRTKPSVVAARYLASIESARHGIVLLHDRVGHVGSRYALQVAEALVPSLKAKGYALAAPVLRFSPLRPRFPEAPEDTELVAVERLDAIALGDLDGDGRADLCVRAAPNVVCVTSERRAASAVARPVSRFGRARATAATARGELYLADVDGDGNAELCARDSGRLACGSASGAGRAFRADAADLPSDAPLRFGDVDGDGRADVCGYAKSTGAIRCARSLGHAFERAKIWLAVADAAWGDAWQLADVDGDGRADACGRTAEGIACAPSSGAGFAAPRVLSAGKDFADAGAIDWRAGYAASIRFGDLNGDGRADVCGRGPDGVACALSLGHAFARATSWLAAGMTDADGFRGRDATLALGDVNGDGRADLCGLGADGVVCGMAP